MISLKESPPVLFLIEDAMLADIWEGEYKQRRKNIGATSSREENSVRRRDRGNGRGEVR